jgi:hypothetical protein
VTLRLSRPDSSRIGISPLDALRSNPVTRLDTIGLHRATSAPPLPHCRNRKVTICPVDMKAIHASNNKKLFRDSVVSTAYPTRHHSFAIGDLPPRSIGPRMSINALSATTVKTSSQSPSVSDIPSRGPSPRTISSQTSSRNQDDHYSNLRPQHLRRPRPLLLTPPHLQSFTSRAHPPLPNRSNPLKRHLHPPTLLFPHK